MPISLHLRPEKAHQKEHHKELHPDKYFRALAHAVNPAEYEAPPKTRRRKQLDKFFASIVLRPSKDYYYCDSCRNDHSCCRHDENRCNAIEGRYQGIPTKPKGFSPGGWSAFCREALKFERMSPNEVTAHFEKELPSNNVGKRVPLEPAQWYLWERTSGTTRQCKFCKSVEEYYKQHPIDPEILKRNRRLRPSNVCQCSGIQNDLMIVGQYFPMAATSGYVSDGKTPVRIAYDPSLSEHAEIDEKFTDGKPSLDDLIQEHVYNAETSAKIDKEANQIFKDAPAQLRAWNWLKEHLYVVSRNGTDFVPGTLPQMANDLGISKQTASDNLNGAVKKLRKWAATPLTAVAQ